MKKKKRAGYLFLVLLFTVTVNTFGDGLNDLAGKTSTAIAGFFSDKYAIKTSIIGFENVSGLTDLAAQQFYQLVVAGLESTPLPDQSTAPLKMQYTDLMVNFNKDRGEFDLNRVHQLNYLIYLKLMRNINHIGVGISIFSRVTDRLVYVKYVEELFVREEIEFFDTLQYGFRDAGFSKIVELDARPDLLDLKTFLDHSGRLRFLFFYPDKIDMFQMEGSRLNKYFSFPLNWGESYYPVMEPEGRLAVIPGENRIDVVAGSNFSGISKVLTLKDEDWVESGSVDFVPFRRIRLNNSDFVAGGRYAVGKNYFTERLLLAPLEDFLSGRVSEDKSNYAYLEKMAGAFYACDFSVAPTTGDLESIHLIDREYKYRLLAGNFEPLTVETQGERGAALAVLDGQWLAMSQYSTGTDRLYFYKIVKGSRRLMYQNDIEGEIVFISEGMWQAAPGFWVCVKNVTKTSSPLPFLPANINCNFGVKRVNKLSRVIIILWALASICAIKPYYGGELTVRLNEPEDFSYSPASYSNLIFFSLIYESFFTLKANGDIESNIISEYHYDPQTRTLNLQVKNYLRFSDGTPITARNIHVSLKVFLDMNLASSRKLRRLIKEIRFLKESNQVSIELIQDDPNIVASLTIPELVLLGGSDQAFSGSFFPAEWVKNQYIRLVPNPYYPGGRAYLDAVKVIFYDYRYPDFFLGEPGSLKDEKFKEVDAGVYQNTYLVFPQEKVGDNTRIALYSLLKDFFRTQDSRMVHLNALTSNDESPVTLNIHNFSDTQVRSILRYSSIKLYILSSLSKMEQSFNEFLEKKRIAIEPLYVSDNQLVNFMNNNSITYLLMGKTFNRRTPIDEKIRIILKEMSFRRFDESYLKLLNQLDEVKFLKNDEMMMDLVARIVEKIMNDGFILPLYQRRFSLFINNRVHGIEFDYYGKPLFQKVRLVK